MVTRHLEPINLLAPVENELWSGADYVLAGNLRVRLFWDDNQKFWFLSELITLPNGDSRWGRQFVLLGRMILQIRCDEGTQLTLVPVAKIDALALVEDSNQIDCDVWGEVLEYADAHLPDAPSGELR